MLYNLWMPPLARELNINVLGETLYLFNPHNNKFYKLVASWKFVFLNNYKKIIFSKMNL